MAIPAMEMILPQTSGGNTPAFLAKLWKMVNNPEIDHLICWSEPEGKSFVIRDQTEFAKSLLPYYYKHSNMASFVRQLNMYDFHKVMNVEAGGLRGERDEVEFAHPYFERGQDHLLEQIKRKVSLNTRGGGQLVPVNTEKVTEVLSEVGMLKNRQEDLDEKLTYMRNENSELWKEVENLRQKHERQQRIVNKLIQFLGAMVQGQSPNGIGMKRKLKPSLSMIMAGELAIEEEHSGHKEPKIEFPAEEPERQEPLIQEVTEDLVPTSVITQAPGPQYNLNTRPRNNTNHVLASLNPYVEAEKPKHNPMPAPAAPSYTPMSTVVTPFPLVDGTSVVPAVRPKLQRQITKEDFDLDVNNMQAELESLKDILSGQISIDTTMVSSLFDAENGELPTFYNSEEGLCLQDSTARVTVPVVAPTNGQKMVSAVSAPTELDLNTPLVQDDTQDPLKAMFRRK